MAKTINESYASIKGAPLRYYAGEASLTQEKLRGAHSASSPAFAVRQDAPPKTDWLEFWVRFVCGFLFGAFAGIRVWLYFLDSWGAFVAIDLAVAAGCGLAAARYGDKFWHSVLGRWWMWD
jgi:hypothetical protein